MSTRCCFVLFGPEKAPPDSVWNRRLRIADRRRAIFRAARDLCAGPLRPCQCLTSSRHKRRVHRFSHHHDGKRKAKRFEIWQHARERNTERRLTCSHLRDAWCGSCTRDSRSRPSPLTLEASRSRVVFLRVRAVHRVSFSRRLFPVAATTAREILRACVSRVCIFADVAGAAALTSRIPALWRRPRRATRIRADYYRLHPPETICILHLFSVSSFRTGLAVDSARAPSLLLQDDQPRPASPRCSSAPRSTGYSEYYPPQLGIRECLKILGIGAVLEIITRDGWDLDAARDVARENIE